MTNSAIKVVSLGGGLGAVQIMRGLKDYTQDLTGVIAVTDTGRSTGIVREFARIPAPGDIRNALATLAESDSPLVPLLQHRIEAPGDAKLDGMAFGNIMIAAMTQMTGSFIKAIEVLHDMLDVRAQILPVTLENTHICAELVDGSIVEQEFNVRLLNKPPIRRIFIQNPDAQVYKKGLDAIARADLITIGPGSLFTTVIACLAFREVVEAIRASNAVTVYICNTTTQPGQTDGFSLSDHVREVISYLGEGAVDYTLINATVPPPSLLQNYAAEKIHVMVPTDSEVRKIEEMGTIPILADVADTQSEKRELWQKQDTIRHEPDLAAKILIKIYEQHRALNGK